MKFVVGLALAFAFVGCGSEKDDKRSRFPAENDNYTVALTTNSGTDQLSLTKGQSNELFRVAMSKAKKDPIPMDEAKFVVRQTGTSLWYQLDTTLEQDVNQDGKFGEGDVLLVSEPTDGYWMEQKFYEKTLDLRFEQVVDSKIIFFRKWKKDYTVEVQEAK